MKLKARGLNLPVNSSADQSQPESLRLQVYLAHCGVASRRSCETYIADGRVSVNGTVVTVPGTKVLPDDTVCVDGKRVTLEETKRYVLLNKPAGFVCSLSDEKGRQTAASLLEPHYSERLYNVGRLDMFSAGLVLFTNDGEFAARVSHPSSEMEKEYVVDTSLPVPPALAEKFVKGIRVDNVFYRCKSAERLNSRRMRIVLIEGKNREIRRVFEAFNIGVKQLVRIRIGNLNIQGLGPGEFRDLTAAEVADILALCRG
ncbi:pseudouridine synthase [Treponema brennaborense]|uniref:Pseudouridine synthase n=1 Tax=Treponema brennaborense (strain DSM 12168 / CIP 105900 / DD5/3) TaxID=906968 RepID=F4LQD5_TREBD|nr:pseudouridine synthase [Treponema brennaborense]AEE17144.1 pseudouridine synthase Rsu [Treponema brennaborense DSM 12168]